jgi:PiT family inorganic phosphate transporter
MPQLELQSGIVLVAVVMAVGGLINARRVAETMSHKITEINRGQGFSANIATALMVISASQFGLPVSTTHVSVGSLFGIGIIRQSTIQNDTVNLVVLVHYLALCCPVCNHCL